MTETGKLESVALRDVWKTEDKHFTPWLVKEKNLSLLEDTLGIELALDGTSRVELPCLSAFINYGRH